MTLLAATAAALLGLLAGTAVDRAAGRFPWPSGARAVDLLRPGRRALRPPLLELVTATLCGLVVVRLGVSAAVPAFLVLVAAGVLLVLVDARHRLLPDRVVLPALGAGVLLLAGAAGATGDWSALLRAVAAAAVLFVAFLALALASPGGLGMGDVKLAALLGLHLGWLGWDAVLFGALAGFVVQAAVALVLLAARRVRRGDALPFGPAMIVGAALAMSLPLS
ncbi:prepilin peptidase [Modestobacter muralis]|uniref:prepilin peptidase n=1 Tax=Modestobacter muralis TaxID=1608614 RepID=UPI0030B8C52E